MSNDETHDVRDEVDNDEDQRQVDDLDEVGELEIEVVDDVDEADKPRLPETAKADIPKDEELEQYSESVQKRMKKLTFDAKEAERQKAEAIRLRDEAVAYAKTIHDQNRRLQEDLQRGQGAVVEQAQGRLDAQLAKAREAYKAAYEAGDSDALLEAQTALSELQAEARQLKAYQSRKRPEEAAPQAQPQHQQAPQPPQQPQVPQLNARQKAWLADNDWYGKDRQMTAFALGVHEELVYNGVDPESENYYSEIDSAMRKRFADKFDSGEDIEVTPRQKKPASVVAPAARSAQAPRKIKLTSSQVALAKRLGLSKEQYAAQLMKEARNG